MNTLFKKTGQLFLLSLLLFSIAFHNILLCKSQKSSQKIDIILFVK